jgi:hypothetical protein
VREQDAKKEYTDAEGGISVRSGTAFDVVPLLIAVVALRRKADAPFPKVRLFERVRLRDAACVRGSALKTRHARRRSPALEHEEAPHQNRASAEKRPASSPERLAMRTPRPAGISEGLSQFLISIAQLPKQSRDC